MLMSQELILSKQYVGKIASCVFGGRKKDGRAAASAVRSACLQIPG